MDEVSSTSTNNKPLFAAGAGIFPSASATSILSDPSCQKEPEGDLFKEREKNDLESLHLDIAPSTLDAIFTAQNVKHGNGNHEDPGTSKALDLSSSEESCKEHEGGYHEEVKRQKTSIQLSSTEDELRNIDDEHPRKRTKKRKKEKHKHSKKKKHKEKKARSRSPTPKRSTIDLQKVGKNTVFMNDIPNLSPKDAFRIDRKSNRDLLHYESISKFHIAKYRLFSHRCLGNEKIALPYHSFTNIDIDKKRKKKLKEMRYFSKDNRKESRRKGSSCTSLSTDLKKESSIDYISIPTSKEMKNSSRSLGSYSCLDDATSLYVQGESKPLDHPTQNEDSFVMDEIFERVARFNQQTREDPTNIELWLKFVDFQDELARKNKGLRFTPTSLRDVFQPPRSVIDKKLAILEKAIELNPSSLELKKLQLELYQDVLEPEKVEKAWEDLLFVHASNVDLWRHYLLRQQARLSTFTFTRMVKKYHRCFQILIPILEGQVKVVHKSDDLEDKLIGLFYQYCMFLHQCGYSERAVSAFQALIEFNLFCPPKLNLETSNKRKDKFEAFWESHALKFGDSKASGWAKWEDKKESMARDNSSALDSTDAFEDRILQENLPRSQTWLKIENGRQEAHCLPWKPDETKGEQEEDCEDPDRLVLFDDISPSLFKLCKSDNCVKIVCLFLTFLGLNSSSLNRVFHDTGESLFTQQMFEKLHQVPFASSLSCGLNVGSKWMPHNCLTIFIRQVIEQSETYFSLSSRVLFTFLRLEFEYKKTGAINSHELSKANSKEIKKFGKNLLKESQNRNNLIIWDSFIRLLWAVSEKMEETASMVDVALGMFLNSSSLSDPKKSLGVLLLCRTFSHIMLNFEPLEYIKVEGRRMAPKSDDKLQVMGCLGALVDGSKFKPHSQVDMSPARVLKIRKKFDALLQQYLDDSFESSLSHVYEKLIALVECLSLFEYCASNFQNANNIFSKVECLLKDKILTLSRSGRGNVGGSLLLKELYAAHISFIMNVMGINSIPLVHLRTVLDKALLNFPAEFYFHYIFLDVESGTHIAGRLRKFYEKHLRRSGHLSTTLFAVLSEMTRLHYVKNTVDSSGLINLGVSDCGLVHRIRSLFENCLHPQASGHCPLLWRLALAFETSYGDKTRAKGLLYRALQNCPWSKSIYMDGVALFGDIELQEMNDLMTEKEIRVRIPLEEVDLLLTAEKESDDEDGTDKARIESIDGDVI